MNQQRSPEWFKQRVGMVTGSRVGAILGLSPFQSKDDVMRAMVREYHGSESEFTGNVATQYGNDNEDAAIFAFEMLTGLEVKETGFHKHNEWLGASPDGLIGDNEVIEVKCPYGKRDAETEFDFKSVSEQPHYHAQMQIEMLCTDTETCQFFQWSENASILEKVKRDQSWLDENLPKLKAFHDEYLSIIESDELSAPHLEDKEVDKSLDAEWLKAESQYIEAMEDLSRAKERVDANKQILLEMANGRKCVSNNLTVFKTERKGSIKYAQIIKDQGIEFDAEKYKGKPTTSWTVKVKQNG